MLSRLLDSGKQGLAAQTQSTLLQRAFEQGDEKLVAAVLPVLLKHILPTNQDLDPDTPAA